jgi:hypothetical protein
VTTVQEMRPVRRHLIGVPTEVAAVLRNAETRGALVRVSAPTALADHRVAVDMVVLEPAGRAVRVPHPRVAAGAPVKPRYRRFDVRLKVAAGVCAAALLAGLGYLVYLAVLWVNAHLFLIIGSLVAVLILAGVIAAKVNAGSGSHCPGCKR